MLAEIGRLVVCDTIMQGTNHVGEEPVVMTDNGIGQRAIFEAQDMSEVDIEGREAKESKTDNLSLVVFCGIRNIG